MPDVRITKTLHKNNNAALTRRYVSADGKPIRSVIELGIGTLFDI